MLNDNNCVVLSHLILSVLNYFTNVIKSILLKRLDFRVHYT